jgi:PEP-CTERM motif
MGLQFGNSAADPNACILLPKLNDESDGLFGEIQTTTPEPAAVGLMALAVSGMLGYARRLRRKLVAQ